MKVKIEGVSVEGTEKQIKKLLKASIKLKKICLADRCENIVEDSGNYCVLHRWGDNQFLPKPNNGETVTKAG